MSLEGHPASTYKHDIDIVALSASNHPVLKGLGPLVLHDEGYKGQWISPAVQPLYRADHPDSDPVLGWVSPYQKSRVVYIQPGHGKETHDNPQWRTLIRNAILWSAGR